MKLLSRNRLFISNRNFKSETDRKPYVSSSLFRTVYRFAGNYTNVTNAHYVYNTTKQQPFCGHNTGQPAIAGTSTWELEDFVGAKRMPLLKVTSAFALGKKTQEFTLTVLSTLSALPSSVRSAPSLLLQQFRRDLKTALHVSVIVLFTIVSSCVTDCNF